MATAVWLALCVSIPMVTVISTSWFVGLGTARTLLIQIGSSERYELAAASAISLNQALMPRSIRRCLSRLALGVVVALLPLRR
jgi:hypothetical protein